MTAAAIVVVGSINVDLVVRCEAFARAGETVRGGPLSASPGGKGSNQALAAARMGAAVALVACVGRDHWAPLALAELRAQGVDLGHVSALADQSTGTAMIEVDSGGQNRIVLSAGANAALSPGHVEAAAEMIRQSKLLVCQLEVPVEALSRAISIAAEAGVPVLMNPAPAMQLAPSLLRQVNLLVPNEGEAALLTDTPGDGIESATRAAQSLQRLTGATVLVTLGSAGVLHADGAGCRRHFAPSAQAVDTTGAGDTFIGALSAALAEGISLERAIAWGQAAAALSVQRHGAQAAMPFRHELELA